MTSEWNHFALGEITELVIDYRGKTPKKLGGDWCKQGYRALSAKNIKTGRIVQAETIRYIDESLYRKWMKDEVQRGDILITSEAPFGQIFFWDSDEKIVLSQRLFCVRIKPEYDARFIYYYMTTPEFQSELDGRATGTTVIGLRQPELMKCVIRCPEIQEQKVIAAILSSIDAKIIANEKVNDNLLEQASSIYQAWFEDFILSDGSCPPSWKQGTLAGIADITSGKRPPVKSAEKTDNAIIPIVGAASVMGYTTEANHTDKILVTGRVGTHGVVQRFNSPCWASDNTLVITSAFYEYTFQILQRIDYRAMNRGSTQPLITQGDMNKVPILIPDNETLLKFETLVGQLMKQYQVNLLENDKLAELREALLPRLMSGELDASDLDI